MIRYAGKPFVVHRVDSIFSELTVDEWEEASILGIRRSAESERENLRQRYGATRDLFHEISSMHAEKAFHVITGGKWHQYDRDNETDLHNLKRHDVDRYQVRQAAVGESHVAWKGRCGLFEAFVFRLFAGRLGHFSSVSGSSVLEPDLELLRQSLTW